jgi:hypothetical protein
MARLHQADREERNQRALQAYLQQQQQTPVQHTTTTSVSSSIMQLIGSQPVSASTRSRSRSFAPVMFRLPASEGGISLTFYFPM